MSLNSDANLSDIVSDVRNIISSDTNEIHLSKSFVDEFGLNKKILISCPPVCASIVA